MNEIGQILSASFFTLPVIAEIVRARVKKGIAILCGIVVLNVEGDVANIVAGYDLRRLCGE